MHPRASIAQLARVPPCHGGCCGFESHCSLQKNQILIRQDGILFLWIVVGRESEGFMRNARRHFESEESRATRESRESHCSHKRNPKNPLKILGDFYYFVGRVFGLFLSLAGVAGYGFHVRSKGVSEYVPHDPFVLDEVVLLEVEVLWVVSVGGVISFGVPGSDSQTIPFLFPSRP